MKELALQSRIIEEIRAAGGWGQKWATVRQNGVPDLILTLPGIGTFFAEVKLVERTNFDFSRYQPLVKTTRLQKLEMRKIDTADGTAFVMVGVVTKKEGRLYITHYEAETLTGAEIHSEWKASRIDLNAAHLIRSYLLGMRL